MLSSQCPCNLTTKLDELSVFDVLRGLLSYPSFPFSVDTINEALRISIKWFLLHNKIILLDLYHCHSLSNNLQFWRNSYLSDIILLNKISKNEKRNKIFLLTFFNISEEWMNIWSISRFYFLNPPLTITKFYFQHFNQNWSQIFYFRWS